jgi:hypothetical protein
MTEVVNLVNQAIDETYADRPAATRRRFVAGAGAVLAGMGVMGGAGAGSAFGRARTPNTPENILTVAATAEVLATIVNTVGFERVPLDDVTRRNIAAAAREELIHYQVLTSRDVGAKPATTRIWVPDAVFASRESFLTTLAVGDQIFCNAYLLATTVWARKSTRNPTLARIAAEFMGVEAVHRALALQSLGRLGNDRAFIRYGQGEEAPGLPTTGQGGFYDIRVAVTQLQRAGFGFGEQGQGPGAFYDFGAVSARTPDPPEVNTRTPR